MRIPSKSSLELSPRRNQEYYPSSPTSRAWLQTAPANTACVPDGSEILIPSHSELSNATGLLQNFPDRFTTLISHAFVLQIDSFDGRRVRQSPSASSKAHPSSHASPKDSSPMHNDAMELLMAKHSAHARAARVVTRCPEA